MPEENPYAAPDSALPKTAADETRLGPGGTLAVIGLIFSAGPLLAFFGKVFWISQAFSKLGIDEEVRAEDLAADISKVIYFSFAGMVACAISIVLLLVVLFGFKNRKKWFFVWAITVGGVNTLLLFPLGIIVGILILVPFLAYRSEFYPKPMPNPNV